MRATHDIAAMLKKFAALKQNVHSLAAEVAQAAPKDRDTNVIALVKGTERYVWFYTDEQRTETLRSFGRYASNPDLSFTWYDAAVMSQKVREMKDVSAQAARRDGGGIKPHL